MDLLVSIPFRTIDTFDLFRFLSVRLTLVARSHDCYLHARRCSLTSYTLPSRLSSIERFCIVALLLRLLLSSSFTLVFLFNFLVSTYVSLSLTQVLRSPWFHISRLNAVLSPAFSFVLVSHSPVLRSPRLHIARLNAFLSPASTLFIPFFFVR